MSFSCHCFTSMDYGGFLEAWAFTVICFLGFYKMITEDTMFENVELAEQNVIKRWLLHMYVSLAGKNRGDICYT